MIELKPLSYRFDILCSWETVHVLGMTALHKQWGPLPAGLWAEVVQSFRKEPVETGRDWPGGWQSPCK